MSQSRSVQKEVLEHRLKYLLKERRMKPKFIKNLKFEPNKYVLTLNRCLIIEIIKELRGLK